MNPRRNNIRTLSLTELEAFFHSIGAEKFRARQAYEWLWKKGARSFDQMTNISVETRAKLNESFTLDSITLNTTQKSEDGTIKMSFRLFDGHIIEGVLIPSGTRMTACISSQVGCNLACKFCATGMIRYIRNLNFDEIFDQVAIIAETARREYNLPLSHIVYMGMGEPMLNYQNVLKSAERISAPDGLGMSPQRITVSTVGVAPMIRQLGNDKVKFHLALSLHSAINEKRNQIVPYNLRNSLGDLIEAVKYFHQQTRTRITLEYVMLKGFNDTMEDAKALAEFCKNFPVKINLIQYNPVENVPYEDSGLERTEAFKAFLEKKNLVVNIRRSRGKDIDAACGQLANKILKQNQENK
ncbi:MAG: 23S rRNA (adenine(2503)-C(2))-methyltransferase RlmN [Bacteroidales bacterium]|nr:23S rRNA (adenine(2503)-C(2))-methyltransferase RlmN [Bacteroidales bacterium]